MMEIKKKSCPIIKPTMNILKSFVADSSKFSTLCKIPVANLSVDLPVGQTGSIVFDTSSKTIVPFNGENWVADTSVHSPIPAGPLFINAQSNIGPSLTAFTEYLVNQSGNSVHLNILDNTGAFSTTGNSAVFTFNLPVQTDKAQMSVGTIFLSNTAGFAAGDVGVNIENGPSGPGETASHAGNVVTFTGITLDSTAIGGRLTFNNGKTATITGMNSPTVFTATPSQTVASQGWSNFEISFGVATLYGNAVGAAPGQLTMDFTYFSKL